MRRLIRTIKEFVLKKIKQGTNRTLILSVLFLLAFSFSLVAFATPPASPYAQNETLDPTCAPGDDFCYTEIPDASVTDNGLVNTSAQSFAGVKTFESTISGSSGSAYGYHINPTVSQSGTAAYIGLLVNVSEGATGSGTHYLADFQVDGASKLNIDSEGNVTAARSFAAGGGTIFPNVVGNFSGNTDSYLQVNIQNLNDGTSASSDFVATADDGDDSSNYVDLGINSSGYNSATLVYGGAHTAYLYASDSDLVVGTAGATEALKFFTGGDANANERIRVTSAGNVGIGDTTPASLLTVGSGDKFQVDSNGNIVKLNNVTYSFPSSQGAAASYLKNNGSGTLSWATLTTSVISEGSNLYYTNGRADARIALTTSLPSLATVGTITSGTWNGTALTDAYVSDLITASNYVPLTQRGVANGVATLNGSGKIPASQLSSLSLSTTYVVASEAAMLALSAAIPGDIAVRTDSSQTFILTDADYTNVANWIELLASSSVLSVNGLTGAVNITTTEISEGTNLYYTDDRVDTQVATQKAQPNGLATLDANGKVPTSQLSAVSANDTFVVASQVAMLALSATQGDLAVRTDESKTYILSDTDPTVLGNWVELLNSASVVSVNGATGVVSLNTSNISESGSLYFTNARARSAISLAGGNPLIYSNVTGVLDMQEADATHDGYLNATDWNTLNDKADVADLLTGATSGTGSETWLGVSAGASSASTDHTVFLGIFAGSGATSATSANFIGYQTGQNASSAVDSNFMGYRAGYTATNASESVFIGDEAGESATSALRSVFIGAGAGLTASGAEYSTFVGNGAGDSATNASYATFLGKYAGSGATNAAHSIFIGEDAGINDTVNNTVSGHSILLGDLSSTGGFKNSIAIGTAATNTAINQLVVGGNGYAISNGFFGNGVTNASPSGFTLNTTGGSGTNIAGGALTLAGGKGTGNAAGGAIVFSTSDAGSSGTTLQTLSEKMRISADGFVGIGTNSPAFGLDVAKAYTAIGTPVFGGTTDDITVGGTYVGTMDNVYHVYIDSAGPTDTFGWYDDEGDCAGDSTVAITGGAQTICNGITVTFGATTGHTGDETWDVTVTYEAGSVNVADGGSYRLGGDLFARQDTGLRNLSISTNTASVIDATNTANIAIGDYAGTQLHVSTSNVLLGVNAGYEVGFANTLTGIQKGVGVTLIGAETGTFDENLATSVTQLRNATAIGYGAQVTQNDSLILGATIGGGLIGSETHVGIGTTAPDASAILDIVSTDLGVLFPRMDTTARDAIASPAEGLLIYNTQDEEFQYFHHGVTWSTVGGGGGGGGGDVTVDVLSNVYTGTISAGAALAGGTGNILLGLSAGSTTTTGAQNVFIGQEAGKKNTTASNNVFVGYLSGAENTTGDSNAFFGVGTGANNTTGAGNVFLGSQAGNGNTTASNNTFVGGSAGKTNSTGTGNSFFGSSAGRLNTTATNNTFVGYLAGDVNTTGASNTFVGMNTGLLNTTGALNTFIGKGAGATNVTGGENVFIGNAAGAVSTGASNVFIGSSAGVVNTSGVSNVFIGRRAGYGNTTGAGNVGLGEASGAAATTGSYNMFIGGSSGYNTTGDNNAFLGTNAGNANTTGAGNTFLGTSAGYYQQAVDYQVALGYEALRGSTIPANNTGTGNTGIGYRTGYVNTSGSSNVFVGYGAGFANTTGSTNLFVGYESGKANSTGQKNAYAGYDAGLAATGDSNAFFGYGAGVGITTGGNNTFLGASADASSNSITKSIAIGNAATTTASNQLVVSSGSTTAMDAYFGNGVTNASAQGITINVTGGSGTNNAGAALGLAGGKSTGNAVGGGISFYTSDAGSTGTTLQTLTEKWRVTAAGDLTGMDRDLGNGVAGQVITLGRNTNATNTGAPSINFQKKSGTAGYVWQDNSGNMRVHTAAPTNANDTAGTVIGTQTSTRDTKQNIEDYTDYTNALQLILDAPLHTFRYRNEVAGYGEDSPLAKVRIGYIADEVDPAFMWGNVIDQVSVNGILMAAVKELDIKIMNISDLTNEDNSLVTALRNWLASATNGLVNIFSDKVTTHELCVDDVCINKDQLRALIENAGQTLPPSGGGEETPPEDPPSDVPPTDQTPPSDTPPSDTPPVDETLPSDEAPPADAPPAPDAPPSDTPPADAPSM